jgi:hypothetical protein
MPQLRQSAAGISPWWLGFDPRSGPVAFLVDEVAMEHVFAEDFSLYC